MGVFLARIGCFFNGCDYGKVCELPWAVSFPLDSVAGRQFPGMYIHPTQLYSSLYGSAILCILLIAGRRRAGSGYVFGLFLVLYPTARFLVDFLRYYGPSSIAFTVGDVAITNSQIISVGLFLLGSYLLARSRKMPHGWSQVGVEMKA